MPPLVVPQAALVRLIWTLGGSPYAINVLGARKTGAATIDQTVANTLGAAIKGSFGSSGAAAKISTSVSLGTVALRDISGPNNPEFRDAGAAVAGSAAGNVLPLQVAMCITLRTARAGKSFRGRMYVPGFTVASNTATGQVLGADATIIEGWVNALRGNFTSAGLTQAIVSRVQLLTEPVTLAQSRDTVWETIRGRSIAGV